MIEGMVSVAVVFVVAYMIVRLSAPRKPLEIKLEPHTATVQIQCPTCRGHGRMGLQVDPRTFTKKEDEHLKFEDFPLCAECGGLGRKLFLSISFGPVWTGRKSAEYVVGTLSQPTSMSPQQPPGDSIGVGDSPSEKSPPEADLRVTSSTPTSGS